MKIDVCDRCGTIIGLPHRVRFTEPVEGHCEEFCLCKNCCEDIMKPLKSQQDYTHKRLKDFIEELKNETKNGICK